MQRSRFLLPRANPELSDCVRWRSVCSSSWLILINANKATPTIRASRVGGLIAEGRLKHNTDSHFQITLSDKTTAMSLQFKINLLKTKQEEDGCKEEENPSVWEMVLFRWALFRYRDNVKCISTTNSLAPILCKILCFKGCRGCKSEGDRVPVFKEPYHLQKIAKIRIKTELLLRHSHQNLKWIP